MIRIPRSIINELIDWTIKEKPNEASGYLFCQNDIFKKIITVDHSTVHFIDGHPEQLLRWIEKYGKPSAIFHSHPGVAKPSYEDLKYMTTTIPIFNCVWLIMSNDLKLRAWTIYFGSDEFTGRKFFFPRRGETISLRELEVEIIE